MNEANGKRLKLKLIACNVFQREACWCLATTPHLVDPVFVELGMHVNPSHLRERLQALIDAEDAQDIRHDAVLLLYGLCGNAGVGLVSRRTPLVIPRAHDCATLLLGSVSRYEAVFGCNPSRPFSSLGYLERGMETYRTEGGFFGTVGDTYETYVERYGEDNAKYIWQTLHPVREDEPALFIDLPETSTPEAMERARARLEADGTAREWKVEAGNIRMIHQLINGVWPAEEYLVVPPFHVTQGVYDLKQVIAAQAVSSENKA
jgi:Protein of unknown function (DUF1638)